MVSRSALDWRAQKATERSPSFALSWEMSTCLGYRAKNPGVGTHPVANVSLSPRVGVRPLSRHPERGDQHSR